jgi:hypothetical protein
MELSGHYRIMDREKLCLSYCWIDAHNKIHCASELGNHLHNVYNDTTDVIYEFSPAVCADRLLFWKNFELIFGRADMICVIFESLNHMAKFKYGNSLQFLYPNAMSFEAVIKTREPREFATIYMTEHKLKSLIGYKINFENGMFSIKKHV